MCWIQYSARASADVPGQCSSWTGENKTLSFADTLCEIMVFQEVAPPRCATLHTLEEQRGSQDLSKRQDLSTSNRRARMAGTIAEGGIYMRQIDIVAITGTMDPWAKKYHERANFLTASRSRKGTP